MTFLGFDRTDGPRLANLFRMTLSDRFMGSRLGVVWSVLSPLSLLALFITVFTFVFPSRLPGSNDPLVFVIWLVSGYGPWLAISEGMSSATTSVISNGGIIRNIAFKCELLPIVGAAMGLFPLIVSLALLLALHLVQGNFPGAAWLILPLIIGLQLVFVSGLGFFLSALQVFVRDTALVLPTVLTLLLFASPIFYPLTAYPSVIRPVLAYNPFYVIAECFRAPILRGELPPVGMVAYLALLAGVTFMAGLWWFRRLRYYFDSRL